MPAHGSRELALGVVEYDVAVDSGDAPGVYWYLDWSYDRYVPGLDAGVPAVVPYTELDVG